MNKFYNITVVITTLISILLIGLDLFGRISISEAPYFYIDSAILIFFTIDYGVRFFGQVTAKLSSKVIFLI